MEEFGGVGVLWLVGCFGLIRYSFFLARGVWGSISIGQVCSHAYLEYYSELSRHTGRCPTPISSIKDHDSDTSSISSLL